MANTYVFENADEAIAVYGNPVTARRKTLVTVREVNGETEVFPRANGDLTAVKGADLVVVPVDGTAPYPCKINLFAGEEGAWVETEPGSGMYRRKALCRYLNIPEGDSVVCKTLEGDATASYPDAIALGVGGEVYTYRRTWINSNLEPVG
jgi:hypothetical protein